MSTREKLLVSLVEASGDVGATVSALSALPWDSHVALATLTRPDVLRLLTQYFEGKLAAEVVENWANAIEGREDIKYETGYEDVLSEVIHQLANPLLTVPLSLSSAQEIIEVLN